MRIILFLIYIGFATGSLAQTNATQKLDDKYDGTFKLFFYKSTLRMLDHENTREFYDMVRNVEKAKLLTITKADSIDYSADYREYVDDVRSEGFESVMSIKHEGDNVEIFIREEEGEPTGMILVSNSPESWFVLDIVGSIDLSKVSKLLSMIEDSEDIMNFKLD